MNDTREAWRTMTGPQYMEYLDKLVAEHDGKPPRFVVEDHCTPEQREAKRLELAAVRALPPPNRFEFDDAADYVSGPPLRWLVHGVIPQAELVVIYGESGSGKSFLAYDICAAITRGVSWAGRETVQGRVAYLAAEGGHGMQNRVKAFAERNGGFADLPSMSRVAPNLLEAKDAVEIAQALKRTGPYVALVVDTLSRSHQGNENSGEHMGVVLKYCQEIHRATGAVIILIHHSGKDQSKGQRGWSGLRAAADAEIEVTRDAAGNRAWSVSKMKDAPDENIGASFKLDLVPIGFDGESSCVVEHVAAPVTAVKPRLRPTGNQLAALQYLESKRVMLPYDEIADEIAEQITASKPKYKRDRLRDALNALTDKRWIVHGAGDRYGVSGVIAGGSSDEPF